MLLETLEFTVLGDAGEYVPPVYEDVAEWSAREQDDATIDEQDDAEMIAEMERQRDVEETMREDWFREHNVMVGDGIFAEARFEGF